MDLVLLVLIGGGVLLGGFLLTHDSGGADTSAGGDTGDGITASEPGAGGYGPDGTYDLITGTSGPDAITGNDFKEVINANGGDDTVLGAGGNDRIFGLGENDVIDPGAGDDSVYGGDGSDLVDGGFLSGTFGDTSALLAGLTDRIDGGFALTAEEYAAARALDLAHVQNDFGNDLLRGEDGTDILSDALGSNIFHGDLGRDVIFSVDKGDPLTNAFDTVYGGAGEDVIFADNGDLVSGGSATDTFYVMRELNEVADDKYVTITDFDPTSETLEITDYENQLGSTSITYLEDATGVFVQVNGTDVAYLSGLTAVDASGADIHVATAP